VLPSLLGKMTAVNCRLAGLYQAPTSECRRVLGPPSAIVAEHWRSFVERNRRRGFCRSHLKIAGALRSKRRGYWRLTSEGLDMTRETVERRFAECSRHRRQEKLERTTRRQGQATSATDAGGNGDDGATGGAAWDEELLDRLLKMTPDAFGRLAQGLLRSAGFEAVKVSFVLTRSWRCWWAKSDLMGEGRRRARDKGRPFGERFGLNRLELSLPGEAKGSRYKRTPADAAGRAAWLSGWCYSWRPGCHLATTPNRLPWVRRVPSGP
jgi:hypothetical protein